MFDVRRHLIHAVSAGLAWALVATALVGLAAVPASAKVPRAAAKYTAAIEPLANYVGQSSCSPAAKPGTSAFASMLLRTYPNSRSLGISRACGSGGKSEHKEGRAFDWGVSAYSARDRASVNSLMTWLLATDKYGNRFAMARRLGIQYMIWNRRIWGSYAAGSGWRRYTGSSPHTDHVHFSLSWAGARKKSSFWNPRNFPRGSGAAPTGPVRPTKPSPDRPTRPTRPTDRYDWPDPRPDERYRSTRAIPEPRAPRRLAQSKPLVVEKLSVSARARAGTRTRKALREDRRYLIEVEGTYRYARSKGAIADAECSTRQGASWWQRERSLRHEEWYADHLDLYVDGHDLYAQADDGQSCDVDSHTYRWVYEAERTGRVPFAIWDPKSYKDNRGKLSVRILDLGTVRDTMSWTVPARSKAGATSPGLLRSGRDYLVTVSGTWTDGNGATADAECTVAGGDGWRRDYDAFDMVAGDWSYDSLSPRMSGVRTMPISGGEDCDPSHTYTYLHRAERTSPLNIRVSDPYGHADNKGALSVKVAAYDGFDPEPEPETPSRPEPTPTPTWPKPSPTPTWPTPTPTPTPKPSPTPTWPTPTPTPTLPQPDQAVEYEWLEVDSRSDKAVRTEQEFAAGTRLRLTVSGMYLMRDSDEDWIVADAECTVTERDPYWRSTRYDGDFNGRRAPLGDLAVNLQIVEWKPTSGRGACNVRGHEYVYDLTTSTDGPLWFVVADDYYADNKGVLDVEVEGR